LLITSGGFRKGIVGPTATRRLSTITDNRGTVDGVYYDVVCQWLNGKAVENITVGTSPFEYHNTDLCVEDVIVSGGTVSEIDFLDIENNIYNLGHTAGEFTLGAGEKLKITYSATPTMKKVRR